MERLANVKKMLKCNDTEVNYWNVAEKELEALKRPCGGFLSLDRGGRGGRVHKRSWVKTLFHTSLGEMHFSLFATQWRQILD